MIVLLFLVMGSHDFDSLYNAATTLLVQFQEEQEAAFNTLIELGQDPLYADTTLAFLVDKFDTKSAIERHRLKDLFKEIGTSSVPSIVDRMDYRGSDEEDRHLKQSLWVLGEIGGSDIVPPVGQFIQDSSWQIRSGAFTALGKSKSKIAHEFIVEGLYDTIATVRKSAYYALSQIIEEEDVPYLMQGLDDRFYGVRYAALQGFIALDTSAIEPLVNLVLNDDTRLFFAVQGLAELMAIDSFIITMIEASKPEIRLLIYESCNDLNVLQSLLEQEKEGILRAYLQRRIDSLYKESMYSM